MAALPRQFPDLALHLTDQTRTPIISSASALGGTGLNDDEGDDVERAHDSDSSSQQTGAAKHSKPTRQQRAAALDDLAATALRARDAAARLGLGADLPLASDVDGPDGSSSALLAALGMTPPEHMVVSYSTGAVVIESFLDPRQQRRRQRQERQLQLQLRTPRPSASSTAAKQPNGQDAARSQRGNQVGTINANEDEGEDDGEDTAGGHAPLLLGLVAAPDALSLGDVRRATARLERVGRAVQEELAAQERR